MKGKFHMDENQNQAAAPEETKAPESAAPAAETK